MGASSQHHAQAALPPGETLNTQMLGWPQSQSGRSEDKKNVLLQMGFKPLIIQPMA